MSADVLQFIVTNWFAGFVLQGAIYGFAYLFSNIHILGFFAKGTDKE